MSQRVHYVTMENKSSTMLPVKSAWSTTRQYNSKCFLFADDTKLLKSFRDTRDEILMQDDLNALSLWCEK